MSAEEQSKAGIRPETIRISVGIEHILDILEDVDQSLDAAMTASDKSRPRTVTIRRPLEGPLKETAAHKAVKEDHRHHAADRRLRKS